ncbi:flagellar basal-body MS-ring/collar protein FliF [Roseomonas fluvialis]|uniref:Flagellar M-ring protein n=1 Tax=Roseomonas fluvialis TaxID=1750527 RepID=A0ABM7Y6K2_9PROT|nr:flagellar basal-body MS-ring/collar protein FliF [Roseomonas fluvialis]BDG73576.1 flagellar M-ring protein [Roseomonas fluvialis]
MNALVSQLRALGPVRLALLGGAALGVMGLLAWLVLRATVPPMALLYADLDPRDASQVVAALERARVPHRIEAGGSRILAPEDQVPRLRLTLAREGLPQGGSVGYEIFDRGESLTTTPFQQDVNRLRALEGEISRSIRQLAGVRGARVHLVLPRREAFSRERGDAQASVVLTMQGAQRLDREGVQAVLHLVATAVPGLRPQNISIVDNRGALLARGGQALAGPGAAQSQEEIRLGQQLRIARAVEEMLERTLGPGRVRAEATVEMDFDRVQTTEERFDPDNQVPRSQQSVQESSRNAEGGPATVQNNVPGQDPAGGGGGSQESRQEETTNFEIGRTTRNTLREHPVVRRQSVAVLVDGVWEAGANGAAATFRERTAEEVARIAALVRGAIGFDERRGDTVEVVSLRFAEPPPGAPAEPGMFDLAFSSTTIARLLESGLFALVALIAILLVGRPAVGRLVTLVNGPSQAAIAGGAAAALPGAAGVAGAGAAALPGQAGELAALPGSPEADAMISIAMVEGQMRASSITRMQDLVDRHPDEALSVVRRWMTPEGA